MRTYEDYERNGPRFEAKFSSTCTIDRSHKIRKKDTVSHVRLKENPLIPIQGIACSSCIMFMD
jgi:hypothetical protein